MDKSQFVKKKSYSRFGFIDCCLGSQIVNNQFCDSIRWHVFFLFFFLFFFSFSEIIEIISIGALAQWQRFGVSFHIMPTKLQDVNCCYRKVTVYMDKSLRK